MTVIERMPRSTGREQRTDPICGEGSIRDLVLAYDDFSEAALAGADLSNLDLSKRHIAPDEIPLIQAFHAEVMLCRGRPDEYVERWNGSMPGKNFQGADLRDANFEGCNLTGCNLFAANLRGTCFRGANLSGALLSNAWLDDADFEGADLSGVQFT